MKKYGPQYVISGKIESCIRLTEAGIKAFNEVYFGRPVVERIENDSDGTLYYFNCSINQLYLYFRRFGSDQAIVVSPQKLRKKIYEFHKSVLIAYDQSCKD